MLTLGFGGLLIAQVLGLVGLRRRGYESLVMAAMIVLMLVAFTAMKSALLG